MKKIIISGVAVAVAVAVAAIGLVGAPYLTGLIAEKDTRDLANAMNADARYGEIAIVSYERGIRSSRVEYEYKLPEYLQDLSKDSDIVEYSCDYSHGIIGIAYNCNFNSNPMYQIILDTFFAGEDPLSITGTISAFGSFDQTIEFKEINHTMEDGAAIKLAPGKIVIRSDSNFEDYDAEAEFGALEFSNEDGAMTIGSSDLSWNTSSVPAGLMLVDFEMSAEDFNFVDQQQNVSISGLKMNSSWDEKNGKLESKTLLTAESVNGAPVEIEDFKLGVDLTGLDSAAALEYQAFTQNMQLEMLKLEYQAFTQNMQLEMLKSLESGEAQPPDPSQAMAMASILEKMMDKGLGLKVNVDTRLDGTPNSVDLSISLLEKTTFSQFATFLVNPEPVLKNLDIRLNASLDAGLLDNKFGVGPMVASDDKTYKTSLKLGAQPELDGKQISIEELQMLLMLLMLGLM